MTLFVFRSIVSIISLLYVFKRDSFVFWGFKGWEGFVVYFVEFMY